jgi:N-acetylated-alpha-linked acidic dipeptidase
MKSIALILASFAASGLACQHDYNHYDSFQGLQHTLVRRQEATEPLALDANEAILSGSFDNTSLESWSYYYTHGLHWAGTNKSMAQWTVDRWNENGFHARLTEYCIAYPFNMGFK